MNRTDEYKAMKTWLLIFRCLMKIPTAHLLTLHRAIERELARKEAMK